MTLELNHEALSGALRIERKRRGLLIEAAAGEVGVSASTLMRIEAGKSPNAVSFLRLCAWLGRDPRDFVKERS